MKTYFTSLLILFCCACHNTKKPPMIAYDKKIINLGDIHFKKEYLGWFTIYNKGGTVLKILEATPDCSCTVTKITKQEIAPQDSAFIEYKITPARDGYIQQNIYLDNNSANESRVLFLIRANVQVDN